MEYARNRGVEVYFFTWNVFTWGAEGKYGITSDLANETTKRYFRASVRELVKTYPLLAGLGITAGEGMPGRMDARAKEAWLWETYGQGIREALRDEPNRRFRLIHRLHWTSPEAIFEAFREYPGPLDLSYKYAVAHIYSSPRPPFIRPLLEQLPPQRNLWLTLRNDDIYTFRFGDPAYVREFIVSLPGPERTIGFYLGSDGYIMGRDFLDRHPATDPRPLVIEKQWYAFALWSRLAYDPTLPDSYFERLLQARHPQVPAHEVFRALQAASQVMPLVTRFFWGDIDLKWYPEACLSHPRFKGFYTVRDFMEGKTMPGAGVLSVSDWCERLQTGKPMEGTTPLEIADSLEGAAAATFAATAILRPYTSNDLELRKTVTDCEALAWLGRYYAAKIRGACALALFDRTGDPFEQQVAVRHLREALAHWKQYASLRDSHYVPALYNRVGYVDVVALTEKVATDIEIAQSWLPGSFTQGIPR
jgi:hypothetical protein